VDQEKYIDNVPSLFGGGEASEGVGYGNVAGKKKRKSRGLFSVEKDQRNRYRIKNKE